MSTPAKLDGRLKAALRVWSESPDPAPDAGIGVTLTFTGDAGDLAAIEALGFETHSVFEDQALGVVRFGDIPRLVEHEGVRWLSAGSPRAPTLDVAVRDIRARATAPISGPPTDGLWHADVATGALTSVPKATGKGVIVAIMDSGIDYSHPMFLRAHSPAQTRILRIWDQGLTPDSLADCPSATLLASSETYGVEFDSAEIEAALNGGPSLPHRDCSGHGTHVAGIAAGGTLFTPTFGDASKVGVAPEADIIAVKFLDPPEDDIRFRRADGSVGSAVDWTTRFKDGVLYCLRTARALGKPIVINMSFGASSLPGDGLDDEARWLDNRLDPNQAPDDGHFPNGAIVVKAAGNDGYDDELPQVARIVVPAPTGAASLGEIILPLKLTDRRDGQDTAWKNCVRRQYKPDVGVHFWYRRAVAPLSVEFAVCTPNGKGFSADVTVGGTLELGFRPKVGPPAKDFWAAFDPDVHRLTIDHQDTPPAPHPAGGTVQRQYVHFFVSPKEGGGTFAYHPGIYELRIRAPQDTTIFALCDSALWGKKDVSFTVSEKQQNGQPAHANITPLTESSIVDSGGQYVITVASYDDGNGDPNNWWYQSIASGSSRGPLRDFSDPANPLPVIPKPNIAAPGVAVSSATSFHVEDFLHWPTWYLGDRFDEKSGTSMASPMVAGVVALMLEKNPNLRSSDAQAYLWATTRWPSDTPVIPINGPPISVPAAPGACGAGMIDALATHTQTP